MGLIIDSFAGGGGASTGIRMATGRDPDIAINHNAEAMAMHKANHPGTKHYIEDIWGVDPMAVTGGQPVDLMWLSPDCTHFSKAKGSAPKSPRIRGLAWIAVKWAKAVRPKTIILENVEEFKTWGPIDQEGNPIKALSGQTFNVFIRQLKDLGYSVEYRKLIACDYGAPTSRKRFFLIANADHVQISWPEATHGPSTGVPFHTAAECIDWDIPCPSIFDRKKPLVENTMERIAKGIIKFVINNPDPFIVSFKNGKQACDINVPLRTQTSRDTFGLVLPHITKFRTGATGKELNAPLPTITAGGQSARPAGSPHALGLVSAFLTQYHGEKTDKEVRGQSLKDPMLVIDSNPRYALVSSFLSKYYGGVVGATINNPMPTVTAIDHNALAACSLTRQFGTSVGQNINQPMLTVMPEGSGKTGLVSAFLTKYYGNEKDGCSLTEPMDTITGKDRMGLVTVAIGGENYIITDIGLRMLQPRELFNAQGFPADYIIDPIYNGKPMTKTAQVRMCGNSVCPPVAEALVRANYYEMQKEEVA